MLENYNIYKKRTETIVLFYRANVRNKFTITKKFLYYYEYSTDLDHHRIRISSLFIEKFSRSNKLSYVNGEIQQKSN